MAEPIDPNWWNLFKDSQLTALERRVAGENLDVQAATVRLFVAAVPAGAVAAAVAAGARALLGTGHSGAYVGLAVGIPLGALIFIRLADRMRVRELGDALGLVRGAG